MKKYTLTLIFLSLLACGEKQISVTPFIFAQNFTTGIAYQAEVRFFVRHRPSNTEKNSEENTVRLRPPIASESKFSDILSATNTSKRFTFSSNKSGDYEAWAEIATCQVSFTSCLGLGANARDRKTTVRVSMRIDQGRGPQEPYTIRVPSFIVNSDGFIDIKPVVYDAGGVGITALSNLHPDCNSLGKSQDPVCISASHRACLMLSQDMTLGLPQEVGPNRMIIGCTVPSIAFNDVSIDILKRPSPEGHPGCDSIHKSQTPECAAAAHRYCTTLGMGAAVIGEPQEVNAPGNFLSIACHAATIHFFSVAEMNDANGHPDCDSVFKSQTDSCTAAVHRKCIQLGSQDGGNYNIGTIQELQGSAPQGFVVGCWKIPASQYLSIPINVPLNL